MAVRHFMLSDENQAMVLETMNQALAQEYTPGLLCTIQKIIDTQWYYYWMNDMKKEEYADKVFAKDFKGVYTDCSPIPYTPDGWARGAKYTNSFMNTAHMGHQPLIWLIDDTHARGLFLFESRMTYLDNPSEEVEHYLVYCHDFIKEEDGAWRISVYRLLTTRMYGDLREGTIFPPDDYALPGREKV